MDLLGAFLFSALQLLDGNPVLLLFLLLGLGYSLGKISIAGFSLGPVAGVLFAGLFFGHYGLRLGPAAQTLGFALFIFSVGYQAGPRFFSALKADGLKYFTLSVIVALTASLLAIAAAALLGLKPGMSAGLLAGGLTSSPTLAAAQDAVREGSVALPSGYTRDLVVGNIASAYAITYIFGLTGLITLIRYLPRWLGIDLAAEARKLESAAPRETPPPNISTRWYRVENPEFLAMTAGEIRQRYCERMPVATLRRGSSVSPIGADEYFQAGDILELIGPRDMFAAGIAAIGPEIPPAEDLQATQETATVVVTSREVHGSALGELHIPHTFRVIIESIYRQGVELPPSPGLTIQRGDILSVVGAPERLAVFGSFMGHLERRRSETDMITFAFGICAGILLGMLSFHVGGIALGLGTAGGLLAAGLVIGYQRSVRPTFGRLPEATSWWLMEFGLLLFMAGIGLRAGGSMLETLQQAGAGLVIAGMVITTVPLLVGYVVGHRWLKLSPAILMGALTGAMTSGASLSVVTREADSAVPAIGYAGTYAFANVLLMVAGPIVILFG
ncbi:MAG: TrkA C-terminal domain-containing protein [Pseudomonadota bacterium]